MKMKLKDADFFFEEISGVWSREQLASCDDLGKLNTEQSTMMAPKRIK